MGVSSPKHARRQILQFSEVYARMCCSMRLIQLKSSALTRLMQSSSRDARAACGDEAADGARAPADG
eukprot:7308952-Heterocapsa_arctica.AAC.1